MQFCHVNVIDIVVNIFTKYYLLQPYLAIHLPYVVNNFLK